MQPMQDVNTYLQACANGGIPESERPKTCSHCLTQCTPHRHGKFFRALFTLVEEVRIPIYRFFFPCCKRTISVFPSFMEPHHPAALDVQEECVHRQAEGESLVDLAADDAAFPGGSYSEKTLWRWQKRWSSRLIRHEDRVWSLLLARQSSCELPRAQTFNWSAWFNVWNVLRHQQPSFPRLFSYLGKWSRSSLVAERTSHPTKGVHGSVTAHA